MVFTNTDQLKADLPRMNDQQVFTLWIELKEAIEVVEQERIKREY